MQIGAAGLLATYAALLAGVYALFARHAPEPYMDEPFHLGQTQTYCAGRWTEWDGKLTTFPGVHVLGATGARLVHALTGDPACSLATLRAFNLLPALATPPLLLSLLRRYHPSVGTSDLLANAALLSLLPTHFFYHFLYYTDSAATAAVLLLLLLLYGGPATASRTWGSSVSRAFAALASLLALAVRQTNAVWIAFAVGTSAVRQLEADGQLSARAPLSEAIRSLLLRGGLRRAAPKLLASQAEHLFLLVGFACFVMLNGGVAIGDASNHEMTLHLAQLAYAAALASAPFQIETLTFRLPTTLRDAFCSARRAPLLAALVFAATGAAVWATRGHPFLLADNRHATFYLWRHVLSRPARRWALAPLYALLGPLLVDRIARAHGGLRALALGVATALVLVPAPLLEPRYLNLPVLLARLLSPPLAGPREWAPPLAAFALINGASIGVFLGRPYVWGDGTLARFMW